MYSLTRFPVIAFDLDGTLVMSMETKMENASHLWHEAYDVDLQKTYEAYKKHSGIARRKLFSKIGLELLGREISDGEYNTLSEEFTKRNIETLKQQAMVPEAWELLSDLKQAGALLAVSSSAETAEVRDRFKGRKEASLFLEIMGSNGEFHKGKPHLQYLAQITGTPIEKMLVVGDEPNDLHLTRDAGAKIALVAQTRDMEELQILQPDILVSAFSELRPYLL